MSVIIKPIEDHRKYLVNKHIIVQRSDLTWHVFPDPAYQVSENEKKAFGIYKQIVIDNPRFKKHPRSIFKG